jgi:hypothetical protein
MSDQLPSVLELLDDKTRILDAGGQGQEEELRKHITVLEGLLREVDRQRTHGLGQTNLDRYESCLQDLTSEMREELAELRRGPEPDEERDQTTKDRIK